MVRIDIVFDTVCPWCFVGLRRLERALVSRPDLTALLRWRPFLLNPDMPAEGVPHTVFLERKFGSPHVVRRMFDAVLAAGADEGIAFDFAAVARTPSSVQSHRLVRFAEAWGQQAQVVEAIFQAYFQQGLDIGNREVLIALGIHCGLPAATLRAYLASDQDAGAIHSANSRAHRLGVTGVPCLVINDTYALAGAHDPDVIVRMLDLAREHQAEPVSN